MNNQEYAAQMVTAPTRPKNVKMPFFEACAGNATALLTALDNNDRAAYDEIYLDVASEAQARAAMPDPIDLLADATKAEPYPLAALPPLLREAVESVAEYAQAPLALAGMSVLGSIAHLAQTRVNAPARNNPLGQPCSLFMLALTDSGGRKTECFNLAAKAQNDIERRAKTKYMAEIQRLEAGAVGLKARALEEYYQANPLPDDPGTIFSELSIERIAGDFIRGKTFATVSTDEAGQLFGGHGLKSDTRPATIGALCKIFDSGHVERQRARSNAERSGTAFGRRMSIVLTGQSAAVKDALNDPLLRGQGFLPRFLFCSPESLAGTRLHTLESLSRSAHTDARMQRYWARYDALASTPPAIDPETHEVIAKPLELESDALAEWLRYYNRWESEQSPLGRFADMGAFASRGGQLAFRLASVLAFFDGAQVIDELCMARACLLVEHSLNEWHRYTSTVTIPKEVQQAADLMEWLKDPKRADKWAGWFTFNSLGKSGPKALRNARKLRAVITVLLKNNHLLTRSDGKEYKIYTVERAEHAERAEPAEIPTARSAEEVRIDAEETQNHPSDLHASRCESAESANLPHTSANLPHSQPIDYKVNPQNPHFPHHSAREVEKCVQSTLFEGDNA